MEQKSKTAILMTGTYRETEFMLDILPEITQGIDYDLYLVLRHITDEVSRLGARETDFRLPSLDNPNVFLCELPSIDGAEISSRYLIPVGPTDATRECQFLSMFYGIFSAISMMKSSLRHYDYVLKTRTDYLPSMSLPEMIDRHTQSRKIIVDGVATWSRRYPDRFDILWQGSISDLLCFGTVAEFLKLWDFEPILQKVWTGIPETTLFRAAMVKFLGDEIQSPRRNEVFLKKYFTWDPNDTKESFHVLRRSSELRKSDEAIYFKGSEVIKYFADERKVKGKVERAKMMEGFVPEILRVSKNFFTYRYITGELLSNSSKDNFGRFLDFMQENIWKPVVVPDGWNDVCRRFYQEKTNQRLKLFHDKTGIWDKKETINGEEVLSWYDMEEDINWEWLCDGIPCLFHGDPQPENVLVTKGGFCLLDWREDFGGLPYGDVYYDLAKVYHRLIVAGSIIREGGYSIKEHPAEYTLLFNDKLMEFKDIMEKFIVDRGYDLKKVQVLSALIYLNSSALHEEPYNRFLYYFGKKYLWELLQ